MKIFFLLILTTLLFSCREIKKEPAQILIKGKASGIPDGMLYLVEARKWKTSLDSALCKNGEFTFSIKADSSFIPYLAAIHYWNAGDTIHPVRLQFRNHTMDDSLGLRRDVFYLEKGLTQIDGKHGDTRFLRILTGRETELLYKNQLTDIGWMGDADSLLRQQKLLFLQTTIQKNPWSYFLIQSIYDSKELYTVEEARSLLKMFDKEVILSAAGRRFMDYLQVRPGKGAPFPELLLPNENNSLMSIVDTTATLNMLVFWASWCGPCIKEIPQLKTIQTQFANKGLQIKSISIDLNKGAWRQAVQEHNMSWPQLLINKEQTETIENIFNFTTIPVVVFTDSNGKEVERFKDYDEENVERYKAFIKKFLSAAGN